MIPVNDPINLQLQELSKRSKIIVFVGLPGTGKSLFINHFHHIAKSNGQQVQVIQWDVARKEFEKGDLKSFFPTEAGQVHPGVRLSAGQWLLSYLKSWSQRKLVDKQNILLIEAPLVGNRFSELCHIQEDIKLEKVLQSEIIQFVLAVPSEHVRKKIEADRIKQISETAKIWSGAKPSVMIQLWKDTLSLSLIHI